jgi:hypothetical protein
MKPDKQKISNQTNYPGFNFDFLPVDAQKNARLRIKELLDALDRAPASAGATYLRKYYLGGRLTARQTDIAKCCDCCGLYVDGKHDCRVYWCGNYPYMPYGLKRSNKYIKLSAPAPGDGGS